MKIIGIIAEYNPFHNGHIYQINKIKEKYEKIIFFTTHDDECDVGFWSEEEF